MDIHYWLALIWACVAVLNIFCMVVNVHSNKTGLAMLNLVVVMIDVVLVIINLHEGAQAESAVHYLNVAYATDGGQTLRYLANAA